MADDISMISTNNSLNHSNNNAITENINNQNLLIQSNIIAANAFESANNNNNNLLDQSDAHLREAQRGMFTSIDLAENYIMQSGRTVDGAELMVGALGFLLRFNLLTPMTNSFTQTFQSSVTNSAEETIIAIAPPATALLIDGSILKAIINIIRIRF